MGWSTVHRFDCDKCGKKARPIHDDEYGGAVDRVQRRGWHANAYSWGETQVYCPTCNGHHDRGRK